MQTLDVISVNLWQILISLANLVLLFLMFKKFLYKPVKGVLEKREAELDEKYNSAYKAEAEAEKNRKEWEEKLTTADDKAREVLEDATENAKRRGEKLIADAEARADEIVRAAQNEAELERKKAVDGIKREIASVSGVLAEKMLEREINTDDHRTLIDSVIEKIGDDNG